MMVITVSCTFGLLLKAANIPVGLIRWKMLLHIFVDGKTRVVTNIRASNSNRPYVVLMVFLDAMLIWGVPKHLCGDHGVENLYTAQWMENYRGVLMNPYIWGQ